MDIFRIHAVVKCRCKICNGGPIAPEEGDPPIVFFNDFKAPTLVRAVEIAKSRMAMMEDDLNEEFEGDTHHGHIFIEIVDSEEK